MKQAIIFLSICCFLIACGQNDNISNNSNKKSYEAKTGIKKDTVIKNPPNEIVGEIYNVPCAIVIEPTDKKIDSLQHVYSDQEYANLLDDNIHYLENARKLFKAKGLKMIEKKSMGTVKFKKQNGEFAEMPLSDFFWGVVLFNGKSDPIEADLTTIEEEYLRYMR
jgi:hypothetical protein